MAELNKYRKEIDEIDQQLVSLLEKRFNVVEQVNDYKKENGLAVLDSNREQQVLAKIAAQVTAADKAVYIEEIFKEIMRQSRNWQHADRKDDRHV